MSRADSHHIDRVRRRSVGFLDREGETWACFLVTFRDRERRWHGYFSFRPSDGLPEDEEIRTADIFLENSEGEIDRKARELGRPLLSGLLASALHTRDPRNEGSPALRRWFRRLLAEHSREIAGSWDSPPFEEDDRLGAGRRRRHGGEEAGTEDESREDEIGRLRSLYESYRIDQVAHFIALLRPRDFEEAVDGILEGISVDFGARDRHQFARIVVDFIEDRLPLPPFEIWAEDYLSHVDVYRLYAHTLHREGRLP